MALSQKERTRNHTEDYRDWIKNGTPEQKELWAREQKLQGKPEHRAEYMAIVEKLQTYLPTSSSMYGGKYGRAEPSYCNDDAAEGVKLFLKRRL